MLEKPAYVDWQFNCASTLPFVSYIKNQLVFVFEPEHETSVEGRKIMLIFCSFEKFLHSKLELEAVFKGFVTGAVGGQERLGSELCDGIVVVFADEERFEEDRASYVLCGCGSFLL